MESKLSNKDPASSAQPSAFPNFFWIEGEDELAALWRTADAAVTFRGFDTTGLPNQRPNQELNHQGNGSALITAERENAAFQHFTRIRRRRAVSGNAHTGRQSMSIPPASMTSPFAIAAEAWSNTMGKPFFRGQAKDIDWCRRTVYRRRQVPRSAYRR